MTAGGDSPDPTEAGVTEADRTTPPAYAERIRSVRSAVREERSTFSPPEDGARDDRAMTYCREGLGAALAVYVEARTNGRYHEFSATDRERLTEAVNGWLDLYARCYGVDLDAAFSTREAAELLVQTHNVRDVAQLLTRVPER